MEPTAGMNMTKNAHSACRLTQSEAETRGCLLNTHTLVDTEICGLVSVRLLLVFKLRAWAAGGVAYPRPCSAVPLI